MTRLGVPTWLKRGSWSRVAVLDTCVLVPMPLVDVLLTFAEAGLYRPYWSADIISELHRVLTGKYSMQPAKVESRISHMERAFPDASVEGYRHLIPQLTNHPKDRHVLAAAITAEAQYIVTANLKDFPNSALAPYGITAVSPDEFLVELFTEFPDIVGNAVEKLRSNYSQPAVSITEFYGALAKSVPVFALHQNIPPEQILDT